MMLPHGWKHLALLLLLILLLLPLLLLPLLQDVPTIWWANMVATGVSYAYGYTTQRTTVDDEDEEDTLPAPLKAAFKVRST